MPAIKRNCKNFANVFLNDEAFAEKFGDLGHVYGYQWRHWETTKGEFIDQIKEVIEMIKTTPDSRRLIVSHGIQKMCRRWRCLPCHTMFQFYVHEGRLSCQLYQRSADVFWGAFQYC